MALGLKDTTIAVAQYFHDHLHDLTINRELLDIERPSLGHWNGWLRDILGLFGLDHRARWYQLAADTAQRILHNARSPSGLFMRGWNGAVRIPGATPGRLRTDAASVSVFAALAAATKPPPSTGGAPRGRSAT